MAPFVLNWGIIGCGWISSTFAKDVALPRPEITDVAHAVSAVGSRDKSKAEQFIADYLPNGGSAQQAGLGKVPKPVAFGSYAELNNDPNVDIVYIGTLHPTHYEDVKASLDAGKHVLVEKPATVNAAEWKDLVRIAKEKNLFLMEAFWTRFQPAVQALYDKLHVEKVIGDVLAVNTDFSVHNYKILPDDHRIVGIAAAGGPLLDIGAYCMVPARIALTENPENGGTPPRVTAAMSKTRMGTDLSTTLVLDYDKLDARAVCHMSFGARSPRDTHATIIGTKGEIVVHDVLCRIQSFSVATYDKENKEQWSEYERFTYDFPGTGLNLEADAVARDIRDGRIENGLVTHQYTSDTLEIFDEARRQGGYVLPEGMEKIGRVGA